MHVVADVVPDEGQTSPPFNDGLYPLEDDQAISSRV